MKVRWFKVRSTTD